MFEDEKNQNQNFDEILKLPIYVKAIEISEIVAHIINGVENSDFLNVDEYSNSILKQKLQQLTENIVIIPTKIAATENVDMYDQKMENATIIRKAARELITSSRDLKINGSKDSDYLNLLHNAVEEFRILFAEWVLAFDPWDYTIDRWGLFNPPGVNYDDPDFDEDLPPFKNPFFDSYDEDLEDDELDNEFLDDVD